MHSPAKIDCHTHHLAIVKLTVKTLGSAHNEFLAQALALAVITIAWHC